MLEYPVGGERETRGRVELENSRKAGKKKVVDSSGGELLGLGLVLGGKVLSCGRAGWEAQ